MLLLCCCCCAAQGIPPAALAKVQSDSLRELITTCIAHDPARRPGALQLLKHAFFAVLAGERVRRALAHAHTLAVAAQGPGVAVESHMVETHMRSAKHPWRWLTGTWLRRTCVQLSILGGG